MKKPLYLHSVGALLSKETLARLMLEDLHSTL